MATTASEEVVHSLSPASKLVAPAAKEVFSEPGPGGEMWRKKFMALQRKCVEYEQVSFKKFPDNKFSEHFVHNCLVTFIG